MGENLQGIKVYCRLRPLKKNDKSIKYEITNDKISGIDILDLKYQSSRNNHYNKYQYHGVFRENISQTTVFEIVALPILDKFLSGMNSTIFTYGQSCSGKTHTMYGSKEDRGIIPRSFEYIFKSTEELNYEVSMEYIEIYNDEIYDLCPLPNKKNVPLDEQKMINKNLKLNNKVQFTINKKGNISFKNLKTLRIYNLSEALKNLEMGNVKKNVSSTSMNIQSSRAHCICIISLSNKKRNTKMKLNLVDLAGSERISKAVVKEKTLAESRSINSSLHHLNHVINLLANPKMYVPYRNSIMTSVLKGSLGAKCATAMIATIVLNHKCIAESMSTCRFSKAVAAVKLLIKETPIIKKSSFFKNKLKDTLSKIKEKEKEYGIFTSTFLGEVIEDATEDKSTNTENNEDLVITSIDNHEKMLAELHDELKAEGIGMNVARDVHDARLAPYDYAIGDNIINVLAVDVSTPAVKESGDGTNDSHKNLEDNGKVENLPSDVELGPNFEIVDDSSNVLGVYAMAPCIVHCGVGNDDNQITQFDTSDNDKAVVLRNSGIYKVANGFRKHCKLIVLLIIIISMLKQQCLIWSNKLDADTENFDSAVLNTIKYLKPGLSMDSILPEWLKSRWDPVRLCPEGNDLQTHCCCGQCLWICINPDNKRTNENVINGFCDCQPVPRVTDFLDTTSDHQSTKGMTWCDQIFEEYLTLANSVFNEGIFVLGYLFVIVLMTMMLFKLFRLILINKHSACNENADSSNSNTQKSLQPSSITEKIEPENLPPRQVSVKQCMVKKFQLNHFTVKIEKNVMNFVRGETLLTDKSPAIGNRSGESQTGFKRYGFRRWS